MKIRTPSFLLLLAVLFSLCVVGSRAQQSNVNEASSIPIAGASPNASPQQAAWKIGDCVQAQWSKDQKWYDAVILDTVGEQYKIHYKNDSSENDELLDRAQLRPCMDTPTKEWTWKDAAGQTRTAADLQTILRKHQLWLDSGGKEGEQANFTRANLQGLQLPWAKLRKTIFDEADLTGANLQDVQLSDASLKKAILIGANLSSSGPERTTNMDRADLSGAVMVITMTNMSAERINLSGAYIRESNISQSYLSNADLTGARIFSSDLSHDSLRYAKLSGAVFIADNLNDVLFGEADLSDAIFMDDVDLTGANLRWANLKGTRFEPAKSPNIRNIADALNLEDITYLHSPAALAQLRNAFKENGLGEQRRKITYAIKRTDNEMLRKQARKFQCINADCRLEELEGKKCLNGWCAGARINYLYYYLNLVFFDWTVRYGMKPERALVILLCLWFICSLIYDILMRYPRAGGILLVRRSGARVQGIRIRPQSIKQMKGRGHLWRSVSREWRLLRLSMFFSLKSAFNIGFREFNVGHWLSLLTKREYELKPKHWLRTIAGFQSLFSLYLIVMWILTHFSQPFE